MSRQLFSRRPKLSARQLHRLGGILIALPALIVLGTGLLLQLKKSWTWVQPATVRGTDSTPRLDFAAILAVARTVPEAEIADWPDIDRLDVRPDRGIVKVRARNHWEIQIDTATGDVLQVAYRRSDVIEALHDGSWFHDAARLWIFLPSGVVLLGLWLTGVYLWFLPVIRRRRAARAENP
ncbi:MAG: PepSY-associated TM helix domain-containing protein [Phycisphaerae bacterium]|jgi:hypothetical protein